MEVIIESFIKTLQVIAKLEATPTQEEILEGYCSKITIQDRSFYFSYDRNFLVILSEALLFEPSPAEEDLMDIANEFANLVVGQAKVLYQARQIDMQIGTPIFIADFSPPPSFEATHYQAGKGKCSIYKE